MDKPYPYLTGVIKQFTIDVDDPHTMFNEVSISDIYIFESLMSPTVQMSVTLNDTIHEMKNYLQYKINSNDKMPTARLIIENPSVRGKRKNGPHSGVSQIILDDFQIYRMDGRRPINYHVEQYTLHFMSSTVINNLVYRMSDFYKNTELSRIVHDAMKSAGIPEKNRFVQKTDTKRDYMSNNQHPFQVIGELADMAYLKDSSAQFLHYMTTENTQGKHYFVSLRYLLDRVGKKGNPVDYTYRYNEKGLNQTFAPDDIMTYEFPCDFDTILDLSGGIIHNKKDYKEHKPSMVSINPLDGGVFMIDGKIHDNRKLKGFGGALNTGAWSNLNTFEKVDTFTGFIGAGTSLIGKPDRESQVENYLHKRVEPITLLHKEKIDLKIIVPFNPEAHVGNLLDVTFESKRRPASINKDYGTGIYLVVHMTHNVKIGGYSTTTFECVRVKDNFSYYNELRPDHQILKELIKKKKKK